MDEAYDTIGITYDFFWEIFGRNSIDDKGMPLMATVTYDQNYDNAFWTGSQMVLGDGDGMIFTRFTYGIDAIAKEFANGLLQSATKLDYWGESGAIFNAISMVLAVLVKQYALGQTTDQANWLFGEGVLVPQPNTRALFSLAAPGTAYDNQLLGKDRQPGHMRLFQQTDEDNGGIHINCGIPNRAFYLMATAMGGYAWEKAGRIWFQAALDKQLPPKARFEDFAGITYATARQLFGDTSDEGLAVQYGWKLVGVEVHEIESPKTVSRKKPKAAGGK